MQEDLSTLSKQELMDKMDALSKETTLSYGKVAETKPGTPEEKEARTAYEAVIAEHDAVKAEYDKRIQEESK